MNCTKCGKEIPEGENKVCDECQKKLLEEIANEENKTEQTQKEEVKEDKNKTKDENDFKVKKEGKNKYIVASIFVILALIVLILAIYFISSNKNEAGNTIGNIRNYGYGTISGNYIYYLSPNEDSSAVGIFKVKKDGTNIEQLYMSEPENEIVSINAYKNYVYFIEIKPTEYNEEDEVDNKIYRMKKDGSDLEVINDNELNNDCYEIYVINEKVYYIDKDANVANMSLDGSDKAVVTENKTGYLGITEDYIIYNVETEDATSYITYIMNIDGTNQRPIIENTRLYSVNIEGDYIYYTNANKQICRTKIDSNTEEMISETEAYNLNVSNGVAYYLNYKDTENEDYTVCIYKIDLADNADRTPVMIKELESYSSFLNIVKDWALYMDSSETAGFINLVKLDGAENPEIVQLYNLDYEEYYNSSNLEEENIENVDESQENPESSDESETNPEQQANDGEVNPEQSNGNESTASVENNTTVNQ